jgi:hypothetical protein
VAQGALIVIGPMDPSTVKRVGIRKSPYQPGACITLPKVLGNVEHLRFGGALGSE